MSFWWTWLRPRLLNETDWDPRGARWPDGPVLVWLSDEGAAGPWKAPVLEALVWMNGELAKSGVVPFLRWAGTADRARTQQFMAGGHGLPGEVLIIADNLDQHREHTYPVYEDPDGIARLHSMVVALPLEFPSPADAQKAARHAIGHVVGFGHARAPQSWMWPRTGESEGQVLAQERRLVKERYR